MSFAGLNGWPTSTASCRAGTSSKWHRFLRILRTAAFFLIALAAGFFIKFFFFTDLADPVAVFAPGQPERVSLLKAAALGPENAMNAPVQPAALPTFNISE